MYAQGKYKIITLNILAVKIHGAHHSSDGDFGCAPCIRTDTDMQKHRHTALTWTCSMDMGTQHRHGHAAWTWTVDMVMHPGCLNGDKKKSGIVSFC